MNCDALGGIFNILSAIAVIATLGYVVEGNWFRASREWERTVRPLLR